MLKASTSLTARNVDVSPKSLVYDLLMVGFGYSHLASIHQPESASLLQTVNLWNYYPPKVRRREYLGLGVFLLQ